VDCRWRGTGSSGGQSGRYPPRRPSAARPTRGVREGYPMVTGKKKPQKGSLEGLLLLGLVVCVFVFVCSLLLSRHPAGAILFPFQAGTALSETR